MSKQWFDVDRAGLGKQAEEHGKGRLIGERIQNALDEAGVTQIAVTLVLLPGRPLAEMTVEDDSPEGFRNLADAYTLFAPTTSARTRSSEADTISARSWFWPSARMPAFRPPRAPSSSPRKVASRSPEEAGAGICVPGPHQDDQRRIPGGLTTSVPCCCPRTSS